MQQWEPQDTWSSVKAAQLKESVELFRSPDSERESEPNYMLQLLKIHKIGGPFIYPLEKGDGGVNSYFSPIKHFKSSWI